ncbi:hypothetical protein JL720_13587 [Aureococcus anophagefferens]|nr:hypothetical protein JL720_13587 [Aureococcus anophagefferens]
MGLLTPLRVLRRAGRGAREGRRFRRAKAKKKKAVVVAPEPPKYAALREWATNQGAELSGLVASECRAGLGADLVATKAFKKDAVFGYLEDKFFAPYVATLPAPSEITATPDHWDASDVESTEWPPWKRSLAAAVAAVAAETGTPEELVRYGAFLASSRAHELRLDDVGGDAGAVHPSAEGAAKPTKALRVLVPFLDTANWGASPNVRLEVLDAARDDATFALIALKPIARTSARGVTARAPDLLDFGFVPNARLDGSASVDGRLVAQGAATFASASTAADQRRFGSAGASQPAKLASKLRIALKSAKINKKHEALFKAVHAKNAGVAAPSRPDPNAQLRRARSAASVAAPRAAAAAAGARQGRAPRSV